ncbi:hypothetical protein TREMEDRAFT_66370 [Tremella mesenterica DSM 1558]|uniref:uncharacterized protein n=1 Tax=Tremella mesenterica (strain ATCC 24925 / CBS 8224 / DSM 1558 / NBRC 9311 / NRRL Y-6157 / RJB 2259-6 / UBC 559-6) TaxID=578456 RepID=UPI00032BDE00|nr:uncharacterized protein TREMEDRAFT_66370 [Tremella mesenterica DSM 1558]EIW65646.1 hypothetical protein TREMEDRAFT_66370 [Tremella mesenterica DSM 1558]
MSLIPGGTRFCIGTSAGHHNISLQWPEKCNLQQALQEVAKPLGEVCEILAAAGVFERDHGSPTFFQVSSANGTVPSSEYLEDGSPSLQPYKIQQSSQQYLPDPSFSPVTNMTTPSVSPSLLLDKPDRSNQGILPTVCSAIQRGALEVYKWVVDGGRTRSSSSTERASTGIPAKEIPPSSTSDPLHLALFESNHATLPLDHNSWPLMPSEAYQRPSYVEGMISRTQRVVAWVLD